MILFNL